MSFMIAIPTAIQVFCWIATIATGRINLRPPMLYVMGFFFILLIGGMTGWCWARWRSTSRSTTRISWSRTCTTCSSAARVFPLFGAFFYWYPKMTGRMMGERLAKWQFWLFFVGFNVAFWPMHHWA
jgi:cytochrome c oxidase subunit 1